MANIKILDCTLRDGGYVNDWNFGLETIEKIITNLELARIDYIECGFLKKEITDKNKTFFKSFIELNNVIKNNEIKNNNYTLMINYGELQLEDVLNNINSKISLRVVFKKNKLIEALGFCKQLKENGFNIFINPMNTNSYSKEELDILIEKVNEINPQTLTIVDTNGEMLRCDVIKLVRYIDNKLNKNISLAFHFHNSLQMAFSNTQTVLEENLNRDIIFDSTVFGIGRGAGNLCIELLIPYLNKFYNSSYNLNPILKIIDEYIKPIYCENPWGYCIPYYLSAKNFCHPNYAHYLIEKTNMNSSDINNVLKLIPKDKKNIYDESLIKNIYNEFIKK